MKPFAARLLAWWRRHGRHDLPWQLQRNPYRVWVAEIMLQQTQVATVIPYYQRFMQRFPDLRSLAGADLDDVLALWSGLGYYARGRNLHAAAVRCGRQHGDELPDDMDALQALPGIGRSTAAAILAQAHGRRQAILDGNVKRVLARHAGIEGWPGQASIAQRLWAVSESLLPRRNLADYTQAIMDLGATVCTRRAPLCDGCPVAGDCRALAGGRVHALPTPRPKRLLPERETTLYLAADPAGRILLERRPPSGIWGGLWCLPEQWPGRAGDELTSLTHTFTHFRLHIAVREAHPEDGSEPTVRDQQTRWFTPVAALEQGLPQPVRRILTALFPTTAAPARGKTEKPV